MTLRMEARKLRKNNPSLREGQALWLTAEHLWPSFAEPLRAKVGVDPFYVDANVNAFLAAMFEQAQAEPL